MEIKAYKFDWNDNFSEIAIEDFRNISEIYSLSYSVRQNIRMALAKLKLLEEQGCKVRETREGME